VFALSGLKHWLSEYLALQEFPFIVSGMYNTYTMFFVYYRDFGLLGLFFFPFLLGCIISTAYYQIHRTPTLQGISVYGMFASVIIFSFFVPIITFLHFAFNFFIIFVVTKLVVIPTEMPAAP
jgi:oligosaccharide repeat unit polymerase